MTPGPRVVVMGGSLGGLTAALVLRDAGCRVDVFEKSRTPLESRGAGIVLHPATIRYLFESKAQKVSELGSAARWFRYLDRDGCIAHEEPCRYRFTSYYTLYQSLLSCLDRQRYQLGRGIARFEQEDGGVIVVLDDGNTELCDLLVCADGIQSPARERLLPDVLPRYAGYVGWRGTVEERDLSSESLAILQEAITYFVMPHSHILAYEIRGPDGSTEPGQMTINFVWYRNVPEGAALDDLMTGRDGSRFSVSMPPGAVQDRHLRELRDAASRDLPVPLAETVVAAEAPFVQVVMDVDVPQMAFGRICLIGDAAFALRPHAAAGTAKAAEDAWKLADAIRETDGDVTAALRRWEPGQLALGRDALRRTREAGDRSQFHCTWRVGDPLPFGLYETGDGALE
jgi:2,6-dihydroxypyridine 3-monooxygenase